MIIRLLLILSIALLATIGYQALNSSSTQIAIKQDESTNILSMISSNDTIAMHHEKAKAETLPEGSSVDEEQELDNSEHDNNDEEDSDMDDSDNDYGEPLDQGA